MYSVHDVPGRLRVKFEKLRNNPYRLQHVKDLLSIQGVYKVKTNDLTGSIVVEYDRLSIRSDHLFDILSENGYHVDKTSGTPSSAQHEKLALTLGKATFSFLAGRVLEANGLSYIAAFI
ncbi:MAG: hypothetical protein D3926_20860 [Desulfobacteraceae bacterium]|nr:MAG: hypothetical protein D3926_20860 [Desulfobacteraceae bacterium]